MGRSGRPTTAPIVTRSQASISSKRSAEIDGSSVSFEPKHGPERLPSDYLAELRDNGWVCVTSVLALDVVDGLAQVGCVGRYADKEPGRGTALTQHTTVARATAEPVSLWSMREYIEIDDIRLSHAPAVRG